MSLGQPVDSLACNCQAGWEAADAVYVKRDLGTPAFPASRVILGQAQALGQALSFRKRWAGTFKSGFVVWAREVRSLQQLGAAQNVWDRLAPLVISLENGSNLG